MKGHLRVLWAALLLLLLTGCATQAQIAADRAQSEADRAQEEAASVEEEKKALSQAFFARMSLRGNEYDDEATKAGRDADWARRHEMLGRMQSMINFMNFVQLRPGDTLKQWYTGEMDRITIEKADAQNDPIKLWELRGEELEVKLIKPDAVTFIADLLRVNRRAEGREQVAAEQRQQGLLLFLGGMQQINNGLQQQQHYNQQQIYQQRLLLELSKPTTCRSHGVTTTCD